MINPENPLVCPACNHTHTEYPLRGRCTACGADLRATIQALAARANPAPDDPLAQVMQARGCHAVIVVLLLSFATTFALAFLPVGVTIKSLSGACLLFAVAFGMVRYGMPALDATRAGHQTITLLSDTFVQMFLYLGVGLIALGGVVLLWIGFASLLGS